MTYSLVLIFVLLILVATIFLIAFLVKPNHVHVDFTSIPGFARINTPHPNWEEKRRTKLLPNGDTYVIPVGAKGHFVSLYDWSIKCGEGADLVEFIIPKGTSTDFASIPRLAHSLISPISNSVYGAVIHDYLYRNPAEDQARKTRKSEVDCIFYWGMRACGVSRILAGLMYLAVVLFGGAGYKRI